MLTFISWLLTGLAALLAVPTAVFVLEVLASLFAVPSAKRQGLQSRDRIAVLVPAHNEGNGLLPTLADIKTQLRPGDRSLVVADNCTDDTAEVATSAGVEVTVRSDMTRIGKGYALEWGIQHLAVDPPAIVVVIDADCRLAQGAIDHLADACARSQRPVQSLYLMTAPAGSTINHQVAEFAWRVKNWVRPLGLKAMALPCQLMGTGMAFPWHVIRSADLSSGFIVEDLKLGLELATAGHPPLFCPIGDCDKYISDLGSEATKTQRHRWEHGHIGLILTKSPALLFSAARGWNKDLLALTLRSNGSSGDAFGVIVNGNGFPGGYCHTGGASLYPLAVSLVSVLLMGAAIILAWFRYGRDILPLKSFALIGRYAWANSTYIARHSLGAGLSHWIRTDRG